MQGTKKDVSSLKKDAFELKKDVSTLKNDVSTLKQDVSGLKQDVSTLQKDVSGLKQDVSTLKQDVQDLKVDVRGLYEFSARNELQLHELRQEVSASKEEVKRHFDVVAENIRHDFQHGAIPDRLQQHETRITRLEQHAAR